MSAGLEAVDPGPRLLQRDPVFYRRLVARARFLSARYYGAPVYLVGSAVYSDDPRDIDLVIVLSVDLFLAVYGDPGEKLEAFLHGADAPSPPAVWRRWARDCARQGAQLTLELRRAFDFKVTFDRDARTISDEPRVLLCHVAGGVW